MGITILSDENMTLTTGINILAILRTAADDAAAAQVEILRCEISQSTETALAMVRGTMSERSGGVVTAAATSPANIRPLNGKASGLSGNTAPVGAVARSGTNASVNTTPTFVDHHPFNFANLNGYLWVSTPEDRILVPDDTIWCVRFLADPSNLAGWTVSVTLKED